MIRKMRQLGIKTAFVTGEMSRSPTFLKVGGGAAEGAIVYMGGLPKEKMPGFSSYAARYKARFGEEPIGPRAICPARPLRSSAPRRCTIAPQRARSCSRQSFLVSAIRMS
ncbi:hypothetical protein SAMN05421548_1426 [Paraburkholderia lycopersici]|uniref:Uncharacterized protein n=1 Tax=Paraburkholderia lycopersici TaxID=416944 RepID=A0A1G7BZ21_9BURK|nr:hypothetical protein SAMN05421548_1426 [Paraburkholderia lycopersici]